MCSYPSVLSCFIFVMILLLTVSNPAHAQLEEISPIELRADFSAPSEVRAPKSPPMQLSEPVPSLSSGPRFK